MDLRKFYLENVKEGEYHYKFFELIRNVNVVHNAFDGEFVGHSYKFEAWSYTSNL